LSPGAAKTMTVTALRKVSLGPVGFQSDNNVGGGFKAKDILWPLAAKDFRVTPIVQLTDNILSSSCRNRTEDQDQILFTDKTYHFSLPFQTT
jgi:hypothetical protein